MRLYKIMSEAPSDSELMLQHVSDLVYKFALFSWLLQILEALLQVLHVLLGMCQALEIQEKGMIIDLKL